MTNEKDTAMPDVLDWPVWQTIEPLDGGFSKDEKFHAVTHDGDHRLLVLSEIQAAEAKRREFDALKSLENASLPVPRALDFGISRDGRSCYQILSWTQGRIARDIAPSMPPDVCAEWGRQAGGILRRFHEWTRSLRNLFPPWDFRRLLNRKLQMFADAGLECDNDGAFIDYLVQNAPVVEEQDACLLHGDFHLGNLVVDEDGKVQVIDFNRMRFGPPEQDFSRMTVFSLPVSMAFCVGQVQGYCQGAPSTLFWKRLAYFTIFDVFFDLLWSLPYGEKRMAIAEKNIRTVWKQFDGLTQNIPKWYA